MNLKKLLSWKTLFAMLGVLIFFSACEKEEEETPTNQLMEGIWKVVEARDADDSLITDKINFLTIPSYIDLDDANSVNSTAGPMFMYIVYGGSKFMQITSKLDQAFNYADLQFTEGEYFLKKGEVVDRFTVEIKLKFPAMETINEILNLMGITPPSLMEAVIYHKFINVKVSFIDENTMVWEFDNTTEARYNIKDQYGDYVAWNGMSVENFTRCKFVMQKQTKTLTQLVEE